MSQSTVPETPPNDNASELASTALSTSFTVATPPTLLTQAQSAQAEIEGIPGGIVRLHYYGRHYVLEADLARPRPRTSWIWQWGLALVDTASGISFFKCGECPRAVLLRAHSTDHLRRHLIQKHRIGPEGRLPPKNPFIAASSASPATDIAAVDMAASLITRVALDAFKKRLLLWIIVKRITFSQVESEEFRELIIFLHPSLAAWLPQSGKYIYDFIRFYLFMYL